MSNISQSGAIDRGHQVGCPQMRNIEATCRCPQPAPIRPDSAQLYRAIADFRRELNSGEDIPIDVLRDMFRRTLEASELLLQSNDAMQRLLEARRDVLSA